METNGMKDDFVVCSCYSSEHVMRVTYDTVENELHATIHLSDNGSFSERLWAAVKYVFGYKSRYGHFDEFLFKPEDAAWLSTVFGQAASKDALVEDAKWLDKMISEHESK